MNHSLSVKYQLARILACISTLLLADQITQTDPFNSASIARSMKCESVFIKDFFLEQRIKPGQGARLEAQ